MDYKEAGVDIKAGRDFVDRISQDVKSTYRSEVLGSLGGFGGCFELPSGYREPVLVSGTDGVGTKLKIANELNRHDTVGIDLVAMCVNDILTSGAEPLFFLDYLATGKLEPQQLTEVVKGIAEGCRQSNCALLGGETAEMPGFYKLGEYDIAGFCVGIVEKRKLLNGDKVKIGDIAIGLPSTGVHSNGFSLVRKIVESQGISWNQKPDLLNGKTLGETLLLPTKIYVRPILEALSQGIDIHSMAHITGGGLPENLPRCLGKDRSIKINLDRWDVPPIFNWLAKTGNIKSEVMLETFNMGIGFVIIVSPEDVKATREYFHSQSLHSYQIGVVVEDSRNFSIA